jgi:hypothetical protein
MPFADGIEAERPGRRLDRGVPRPAVRLTPGVDQTMTDDEVIEAYQTFSDEELLSLREACRSEAEAPMRWQAPRNAAALRERAKTYTRAIRIRGLVI